MTFTLKCNLPSGKNAVKNTRTGHRYPNKRFVDWRTDAMQQITQQCGRPDPIAHPIKLIVDYTPGDKRVRDVAGMLDALGHLLERAGVIAHDGLIRDCAWHEFEMNRAQPQACVTLQRRHP